MDDTSELNVVIDVSNFITKSVYSPHHSTLTGKKHTKTTVSGTLRVHKCVCAR